jgi:hypothetical protein
MTAAVRTLGALALLAAATLSGCATTASAPPGGERHATAVLEDPVAAAAELLQTRYELVRDGDYAAACELYTPGYQAQLAQLAEVEGQDCVAAHEAGAANAAEYLATAEEQGRAGLTPFFYVPSGIEIDRSKITSDDADAAIAAGGAVVSTDTREFEDGAGKTPGWLSGVIYIVRGDDATWRLATPGGE